MCICYSLFLGYFENGNQRRKRARGSRILVLGMLFQNSDITNREVSGILQKFVGNLL